MKNGKKTEVQEIGKVIRGASPRPQGDPRYYGGNVPRLMGRDVTRDGKYVTPKIDFLTEAGAKLSRYCEAGTLTIICSGNVGIPSFLAVDACIHDGFLALKNISQDVDENFLFYQLVPLQEIFERSATHGGVFVNLTTEILRKFNVQIPTLPEQEKIAAFLSAVDEKLAAVEAQRVGWSNCKRRLMQDLFTQALRFKSDDGTDFPDWVNLKLEDRFSFHKTNSLSRAVLSLESNGIENIHYGDIHTKYRAQFDIRYESTGIIPNHLTDKAGEPLMKGDVIFADASEDYNDVGKAIEVINLDNRTVVAGLHTIVARPKEETIALGFAAYLFASWPLRKQLMRIANGASVLGISKTNLAKVDLTLPSLPEQQKIAEALSAIDAKIEALTNRLDAMREFKTRASPKDVCLIVKLHDI